MQTIRLLSTIPDSVSIIVDDNTGNKENHLVRLPDKRGMETTTRANSGENARVPGLAFEVSAAWSRHPRKPYGSMNEVGCQMRIS